MSPPAEQQLQDPFNAALLRLDASIVELHRAVIAYAATQDTGTRFSLHDASLEYALAARAVHDIICSRMAPFFG